MASPAWPPPTTTVSSFSNTAQPWHCDRYGTTMCLQTIQAYAPLPLFRCVVAHLVEGFGERSVAPAPCGTRRAGRAANARFPRSSVPVLPPLITLAALL